MHALFHDLALPPPHPRITQPGPTHLLRGAFPSSGTAAAMASPGEDAAALSSNAAFMDKYSRQIGAFGMEAMSKLIQLKVLIVGLKGVGVETAKNLILAGPGAVTLWDDHATEVRTVGRAYGPRT